MSTTMPADAVAVGRIAGAFGIKGWIKVQPFSFDASALGGSTVWWTGSETPRAQPLPASFTVLALREQGENLVAQLEGVDDRNAAEALRGVILHVPRSSFPKTPDGEFYWIDLIGLAVHNREQQLLGKVIGLIDTGPHCVLRIAPVGIEQPSLAQEILIPFVSQYGCDVDLAAGHITVDWQSDWANDAE
jgi:16S rRNA processing protein RimM